jgi:hypothetical protein
MGDVYGTDSIGRYTFGIKVPRAPAGATDRTRAAEMTGYERDPEGTLNGAAVLATVPSALATHTLNNAPESRTASDGVTHVALVAPSIGAPFLLH